MRNRQILLSIGIVNWNTKSLLLNLLRQLEENSPSYEYEVIVVDNSSSDGSAKAVKENFPGVQLIENPGNVGFTRACNQIMKMANGRYVLLLNTDLIIPKGGIDRLVEFMEEHEDAALCGPKLLYPDGSLQASVRAFHTLSTVMWELTGVYRLFPKSRIFGKYLMTYWDHNDVREVDFVSGAVYMMRKEAIEDVGYFDERYFLYVQDADWSYRAKKKGWKVYYVPDVAFVHLEGQSVKRISYWKGYYSNLERLIFFRLHYGIAKARALYLMTCISQSLKALLRTLSLSDNVRNYAWLPSYRRDGYRVCSKSQTLSTF